MGKKNGSNDRRAIGAVMACAAVFLAAGQALSMDQASQGKSAPDAGAAEAARAHVMATFVREADDGAPGKVLPAAPEKGPRPTAHWKTFPLDVPAELSAAELPTYYVYEGKPVEMRVDETRVGVKFAGLKSNGGDDAMKAAMARLGVAVASVESPNIGNWRIVTLAVPAQGAGGVNAIIDLLLTDPAFEFATPVFHHATIEAGYYMVTPEVNIRVTEAAADRADAVIANVAKGFAILPDGLGGLKGARQVRAVDRNGFRVLRAANTMCAAPEIAWAEPDAVSTMRLDYTPNDEFWGFSSMWGWEQNNDIDTDAEGAWDLTRGNPNIKVLVMDCGVEQNHPDINQLTGRDFTTGAVNGVGDGDPSGSCDRHGTSVASIISGRINNGIGGAGVCPNCRTISAKTATEQSNPCSSSYAAFSGSWVANALAWGAGQGCIISNSSFGVGSSSTIANAYDNAEAGGMIHFGSAGNGGSDSIGDPTLGYPSSLDSVQAVAAIDFDGGRSSFSNWGTGLQFATPGTNVRAADRQSTLGYNDAAGTAGNYTQFGGTSAASPFCAGICALIWSAYPDYQPASILSLMKTSATDLGAAGYDTGYGWGFPNADFALRVFRPDGDWCDEAVSITTPTYEPAPFSVTGRNAVIDELQESCELNDAGVSHSTWYTYVPPCTGTLDINTNGSDYDTVLSVYRGNCLSATTIACDDDGGTGTQSQLTDVPVTAGFTYLIKVSAYGLNNAGGTLDFNFAYTANPPVNDDCADATTIIFTNYSSSRCTLGATSQLCESNETCEAGNAGTSRSAWWAYTPAVNGRIDVDTNGSDYDTVLSVWNGCFGAILFNGNITCLGSTQIACDDDGGAGLQSMLTGVNLRKGVTYRIKAAGFGTGNAGGDLSLNFQFRRCPGDHNQSGAVTVQDIFDFLADYFANNLAADYNNSGTLTVQDIFDYLAIYFGGLCE